MEFFIRWSKRLLQFIFVCILIIIGFITIVNITTKASNDREWNTDQAILPYADIVGDKISIHNIRNFSYTSTTEYTPDYYNKTFDLRKLKKVWYVVEPFSGIPGSAHTFLSFEFEGNQFVSISVEIRKEKGETYHPVKGLLNRYELMYVIADERDVIKLRSNYRKDLVYVYPIKTTTEKAQQMFLDMVIRANYLRENPEFYNTITNTCTTNIVKHVDKITPNKVPLWNLRILLPAKSDKLAYELGLIDTDLSFLEAREYFNINDRALKFASSSDFSLKIRK